MSDALIDEFERLIRRDPARRGLIGTEPEFGPLCPGHLSQAAQNLASSCERAVIVTGFYVPHATPPAAETDGPPGALLLGLLLSQLGVPTTVATDEFCFPAVATMALAMGFPVEHVLAAPLLAEEWVEDFLQDQSRRGLTHVIAVERVGPSHTRDSLLKQHRTTAAPLREFISRVPKPSWNHCHNMRGLVIDAYSGGLHLLFERLAEFCPQARTIGIGDGANEIGMGTIPWEHLWPRLPGEQASRIPCRIATNWTILAGTSNWGAFALAAAVMLLRDRVELLHSWDCERHLEVLERMVHNGPAVDGVTGRQDATVDGLPFLTYIQPWAGIRSSLELEP